MPESVSNPFSFGFSDNNAYLRRYGYTGLLGTANEKDYDLYLSKLEAQTHKDQWWFENYDSEEARWKRLESLGINRQAIAQSILGSPSDATSSPPPSSSNQDPTITEIIDSAVGALNGVNNIVSLGMQSEMNSSVRSLNSAMAKYYASGGKNLDEDTRGKSINNDNLQNTIDTQNANVAADTANTVQDTENKKAELKLIEQNIENAKIQYKLTEQEVKLLESDVSFRDQYNEAQIQQMRANASAYIAAAAASYSEVERNSKLNELTDAEIDLTSANIEKTNSEKTLIDTNVDAVKEETRGKRFVNDFEAKTGVPLTADEGRYIEQLANKGDFVRIRNYMSGKLDVAYNSGKIRSSASLKILGSGVTIDSSEPIGNVAPSSRYTPVNTRNP